jgi:hypothetical protein
VDVASWARSIVQSFKSQTATWVVGFLIAIISVFSSKIVENIKFAINKEDLRSKYYEELVSDVSEFRFESELLGRVSSAQVDHSNQPYSASERVQ